MSAAHWHLLLNHFPIIGIIIGSLVLLTGFVFKGQAGIRRVSMGVFILSALVSVPAYFSGEGAEEIVEQLPGVSENLIERHEDQGKIFFILSAILGLCSALTLFLDIKGKLNYFFYLIALLLSFATSLMGVLTGLSGGQVRHSEIREDSTNPVSTDGEMDMNYQYQRNDEL